MKYAGVQYSLVRATDETDNFIVLHDPMSINRPISFVSFPTSAHTRNPLDSPDLSKHWYRSVEECSEKIKNWVHISAKNKVKEVEKDIPVYYESEGYVCAITKGVGWGEMVRKGIRMPSTLLYQQSSLELVNFIGCVEADDAFKKFRVSILMTCGDYFHCVIFTFRGTIEEIEKEIVKFLVFVNPESLENARDKQAKKEALFD